MKRLEIKKGRPIIQNAASDLQVLNQINVTRDKIQSLINESNIKTALGNNIASSKVNDEKTTLNFLLQQFQRDIKLTSKFVSVHFLITPGGDIVSTKAFLGQYGIAFITNELNGIKKYINAAKRPETYRKHGVIICEAKVEIKSAVYLRSDLELVYAFRIGSITPCSYKFGRINTSVAIMPEIEEAIKSVNTQRFIKFYNK